MIEWTEFIEAVEKGLGKHRSSDPEQIAIIRQSKDKNLVVYAGPGTGKTATLTLRIIKLVLVDGVLPQNILATTFTRKAAKELRSRIIDWSEVITSKLSKLPAFPDWNLIMVDTLDSISEQIISDHRGPRQLKHVVMPERTARQLWANILLNDYPRTHQEPHLVALANDLGYNGRPNFRSSLSAVSLLRERAHQDCRPTHDFFSYYPKYKNVRQLIEQYESELEKNLWLDFTGLELSLLHRLENPDDLQELKSELQIVLVDEYQDTNRLQEKIYFEMAKIVSQNEGGITIVGDDDQSLFRFRGSNVDLFSQFQKRMQEAIDAEKPLVYTLKSNYRSTGTIVSFANHFIQLDASYQEARARFTVNGSKTGKPSIIKKRPDGHDEFPILMMLRGSRVELAKDLSSLVSSVFQGKGYVFNFKKNMFHIERDRKKGSFADVALLCASPKEKDDSLPLHMREQLMSLQDPILVFNPRGRDLAGFTPIMQLMGLILLCIDPEGKVQESINQRRENHQRLNIWRSEGNSFLRTGPVTAKDEKLDDYMRKFPRHVGSQIGIIELIHDLVSWFPYFQDDPEGLALLEQIMRIVTEAALLCRYDMNVINHRSDTISNTSRKEIVRHFCFAVIDDMGEMDEDLLLEPPRDRFSIMSIHQAKGLEFPLTIVDVGARFKMDHSRQRFMRFPESGSTSHLIEDLLAGEEIDRNGLHRAFDDLTRLYYVSFTRAQDVLLLVGLSKNLEKGNIKNVAMGWDRDANWMWKSIAQDYRSGRQESSITFEGKNIPVVFI